MSIVQNKDQQVKSKKRVADHGEVFTNEREVNAMLDLVKDQTERIEATFLEPACGDRSFLIDILRRLLNVIKSKYFKSRLEYNANIIIAIYSIYGVELFDDNALHLRERLCKEIQSAYLLHFQQLQFCTINHQTNHNY